MNDEARLQSVMNMAANSSVLWVTALATGLAGGEEANNFYEAVKNQQGKTNRNISAVPQELLDIHAASSAYMTNMIEALSAEKRAELIEKINDESYTVILNSISNTDFGLPKITERLECEVLAKYLNMLNDQRLCEIIESVMIATKDLDSAE